MGESERQRAIERGLALRCVRHGDVYFSVKCMTWVACHFATAASASPKVQGAICVQPPYVYVQTIAMLVNVRISEKS